MKKISGLLALLFTFCLAHAQDKTLPVGVKENKAKQILENAKKATSKKISVESAKSFTFNTEESFQYSAFERKIQGTRKVETNLALPDKIRQTTLGNYSTNQENSTYLLNGDKFSSKMSVFVNGKFQQDFSSVVDKEHQISKLKSDAFLLLFPITLDASWYFPLEFQYFGIAESKDGKAEVIEAVSPKKVKYRLFFDVNTHLLLMMTKSWTDKENKPGENKYFFSDYQEKDGLLIATKIVTESDGEVAEERQIKELKVNPAFKPDLFEVK